MPRAGIEPTSPCIKTFSVQTYDEDISKFVRSCNGIKIQVTTASQPSVVKLEETTASERVKRVCFVLAEVGMRKYSEAAMESRKDVLLFPPLNSSFLFPTSALLIILIYIKLTKRVACIKINKFDLQFWRHLITYPRSFGAISVVHHK